MRTLTALIFLALPFAVSAADKPNIIVLMTDDQRFDYMSCMGHPFLKTPNMDRIAAEEARCKNMFVTNSLCAPSRATLMTGLYSHANGVIDNMGSKLRDDVAWMPDLLRQAGYEVAFCGKSHVPGNFRNKQWDYYFGYRGQGTYNNPVIAEGTDGQDKRYDGYIDDIVTDHALKWMTKPRTKPFCLFLFFKAPHRSWVRAERHKDLFKDVVVQKPEMWDEPGLGKPPSFIQAANMIGQYPDTKSYSQMIKDLCCTLTAVDENVGRVMAALTEMKKLDQTAILYTSDNGFFLGEWQRFDKRLMHEPSIRVPMLVRYPALIKAGTVVEPMVLNLDIAPTLLDLAGVPAPKTMQGKSFIPVLQGNAAGWRKDWLYSYHEFPDPSHQVHKNRGIRTERYKLIQYYDLPFKSGEEFELYDLQTDPQEKVNLYNRPMYQPLVKELKERLAQLRKEVGDN